MRGLRVLGLLGLLGLLRVPRVHSALDGQLGVVQWWARRLGEELTDLTASVTRIRRVHESYKAANVLTRNGTAVLSDLAQDVQGLLQHRMHQVQEIRRAAEALGLQQEGRTIPVPQPYVAVKKVNLDPDPPPGVTTTPPTPTESWLFLQESFPSSVAVNSSISAVHVPTTIYDGSRIDVTVDPMNSTEADIQRAIKWTQGLNEVFKTNMRKDKTTSWQFFAHHLGFMRQFPASEWPALMDDAPDIFDARLRPWYLGAATSAKDIVILLDNSGSMLMTEPSKLSRQVVMTLLDTLNPDDFVNVLIFSERTYAVVPGLDGKLIPATAGNVRELKRAVEETSPEGVANFGNALKSAFVLLEEYRRRAMGAACNQAVMLVTDLVPEHEEEVFARYNWPEQDHSSPGLDTHVRVFTFLVGDPEDEATKAKWMACANRGWHLSMRMSEHDQAIRYIPVMARPLVLQGSHPVHWTHMYADITSPAMTDFLWKRMQANEQFRKMHPFCFKHLIPHTTANMHYLARHKPVSEMEIPAEEFVVTVSVPVHNISKEGRKNGELLGVAGIDVPVEQIKKYIRQHKAGVNGYFFMVTNNGLVVFHPDLRSKFNAILKPGYNSVEMVEVEIEDVPLPRNLSKSMRELHELVVNQTSGSVVLAIKQTYENMKRVSRWNRRYFFQGLEGTPYSLVLAVPEDYGGYRIQVPEEGPITWEKLSSLLGPDRWSVHPEWLYCEVPGRQGLERLRPRSSLCDRELLAALAHDAKVTKWFSERNKDWSKWEKWNVGVSFVSTHSGLTRWMTMPMNSVKPDDLGSDGVEESRGPDELWYRRAVEAAAGDMGAGAAAVDHSSPQWVFSVPHVDEEDADPYSEYNAAYDPEDPVAARRTAGLGYSWGGYPRPNLTMEDSLVESGSRPVTASAAVFRKRAPVAAVGTRFPQRNLQALFDQITTTLNCPGTVRDGEPCGDTCLSEQLDCFLLDEHGLVLADESGLNAGRPLARIQPQLMAQLEAARVFQRVPVYDYQAVCRRPLPGRASRGLVTWSWGCAALAVWGWGNSALEDNVFLKLLAVWLLGGAGAVLGSALTEPSTTPEYKIALRLALLPVRVNKTVLQSCDMRVTVHRVGPGLQKMQASHHQPLSCEGRSFVAAPVPGTNLVLVTALNMCPTPEDGEERVAPATVEPQEVTYRTPLGENISVFYKAGLVQPRRRSSNCYREHVGERDIQHCGRAEGLLGAALWVWATALGTLVVR